MCACSMYMMCVCRWCSCVGVYRGVAGRRAWTLSRSSCCCCCRRRRRSRRRRARQGRTSGQGVVEWIGAEPEQMWMQKSTSTSTRASAGPAMDACACAAPQPPPPPCTALDAPWRSASRLWAMWAAQEDQRRPPICKRERAWASCTAHASSGLLGGAGLAGRGGAQVWYVDMEA